MSKRMFESDFLEKDIFVDLGIGAKILYIYLNLYADDEGFIGSTRKALVMSGASTDDMKVLLAKNLIKELNENDFTKVYVVTDFWENNSRKLIYSEGYQETQYQIAKGQVVLVGKAYMNIEDYNERVKLGENLQITELKKGHSKTTKKKFEIPTIEEIEEYCKSRNNRIDAKNFYDYYTNNEWTTKDKNGKRKPMENWKNTVIMWENNEKKRNEAINKPKEVVDYMKY